MYKEINFEEVKDNILTLSQKLGRIPKVQEIYSEKIIGDIRSLKKYFRNLGYTDWLDYYREKGLKKEKDIRVIDVYKSPKSITLEDIRAICLDFFNKNRKYPTSVDFNTSYNEMPSYTKVVNILFQNNISWFDFLELIGENRFHPDINKYNDYLIKFKQVCNEIGRPLKWNELLHNEYNLPSGAWLVRRCPNKDIKNYNQFIEFAGFIPRYNMSKELAIKLILDLQLEMNRPLMQDDFYHTNDSDKTIGISTIKNFWGTMNKMKEELGLEIVQESMTDKQKTKEEMIMDMENFINELGRLPKTKEINNNKNIANACTYHNYFGGINNVFLSLGYIPNKKDISKHLTNDEIIESYKEFAEDLEVTPTYEFCKNVYKLPSPRTVVRRLNCSWNEFMDTIGCIPNSNNKRGEICYAKDGTMCFSALECIVHNFIIDNNINIISKEYYYRDLVDNEQLKLFIGYKRCDWLLKGKETYYIVEYFGLYGSESYMVRHDKKIEFLKKANLHDKFIAIYPKDLNKLDEVFKLLK